MDHRTSTWFAARGMDIDLEGLTGAWKTKVSLAEKERVGREGLGEKLGSVVW